MSRSRSKKHLLVEKSVAELMVSHWLHEHLPQGAEEALIEHLLSLYTEPPKYFSVAGIKAEIIRSLARFFDYDQKEKLKTSEMIISLANSLLKTKDDP